MEFHAKAEKAGQPDGWKKGYFYSGDLREWEKAGGCRDGVDFFNTVKHRLEETIHATLNNGYKISAPVGIP